MLETFRNWETYYQMQFAIAATAIIAMACVFVVLSASKTLRIVFRGYPPPEDFDTEWECKDDRNLSKYCIKMPHCRTTHECYDTVSAKCKRLPLPQLET